jgi:hypothetical protein
MMSKLVDIRRFEFYLRKTGFIMRVVEHHIGDNEWNIERG